MKVDVATACKVRQRMLAQAPRSQRARSKPDAQEPWNSVGRGQSICYRQQREGRLVTKGVPLSGSCSLQATLLLSPHFPFLPISAIVVHSGPHSLPQPMVT